MSEGPTRALVGVVIVVIGPERGVSGFLLSVIQEVTGEQTVLSFPGWTCLTVSS